MIRPACALAVESDLDLMMLAIVEIVMILPMTPRLTGVVIFGMNWKTSWKYVRTIEKLTDHMKVQIDE